MEAELAQLRRDYERLEAKVKELTALLNGNSTTSHQPPSKDPPWAPKSERQKSGRSPGGQKGHPGRTLKFSDEPDFTVPLSLTGQCGCGQVWEEVAVSGTIARQVHDLPELRLLVTEYQAEVKICPQCSYRGQAPFPEDVPGVVQYGPGVHALTTYLHVGHFISLERVCEIMEALFGASISDGTIVLNLNLAAERLVPFEKELKTALQVQPVLHADETGSKVNGERAWFHVVCSAQLALYTHSPYRGIEGLKVANILPTYTGVLVHDAWSTYMGLPSEHALCNAHLLRDLRKMHEHHGQSWAGELRTALQGVYHALKQRTLTLEGKVEFYRQFDELVLAGLEANPALEPVPKKRGQTKQLPGRNLAVRCQQHRDSVLRFLEHEHVPFDNNMAERDLRMLCVKRKVSGGFRSEAGGAVFCRIRSFIATYRKQGLDVWQGLLATSQNSLLIPALTR